MESGFAQAGYELGAELLYGGERGLAVGRGYTGGRAC